MYSTHVDFTPHADVTGFLPAHWVEANKSRGNVAVVVEPSLHNRVLVLVTRENLKCEGEMRLVTGRQVQHLIHNRVAAAASLKDNGVATAASLN